MLKSLDIAHNIFPYSLTAFVFCLGAFFLYYSKSKRGAKWDVQLMLHCKVMKDFGEITIDEPPQIGAQKLYLFGCEKDGEKFLALQAQVYFPSSRLRYQPVKLNGTAPHEKYALNYELLNLNSETVKKVNTLINSSKF